MTHRDGEPGPWIEVPWPQGMIDYHPSTDWAVGGPLIERERIELQNHACSDGWWAGIRQSPGQNKAGGVIATGPTPLIAAMRAYVASRQP